MKSLKEFIIENNVTESNVDTKEVVFDFDGIDNAEDTVKSLGDSDCVTVDGNKVTVKITVDNADSDCVASAQELIQQAVSAARASDKSTNNEQYAQKVAALEKKVAEMTDAIDEIVNPDTDDDKDTDEGE